MQTAEPVYVARGKTSQHGFSWIAYVTEKYQGETRTVGCAAATQNRIATCALDSRDYGAGRCVALDQDELVLQVGLDLPNPCALLDGFSSL